MDLINKITSAVGIGKPPQPFVEPDFQNMTKEQQDRWADAQQKAQKDAETPSYLSSVKSFFTGTGGRRPKKPTKKKPKNKPKQTKNKRK
jgi:hypothetical protein